MKYKYPTKPYDHQRREIGRLWKRGSDWMTWDPGTGKTKTLVDYSQVLYAKLGRPLRVLIIAPINALGVWPDQIKRHSSSDIDWQIIEPQGSIAQKAAAIYEWI